MRLRLIDSIRKPLLDPRRVERTFRSFDQARGFADFHATCQATFRRTCPAQPSPSLQDRGFEHIPVLEPDRASVLLTAVTSHHPVSEIKKSSRALLGYRLTDPGLERQLLDAVLTAPVDARLTGFFGSEYLVLWMNVSVTHPAPAHPSVSFHWHCDKGPRDHLKLLVYLNGSAEHGGNTDFIPLPDTAAVAAHGYVFGRTGDRTNDVAELARIAGRPLEIYREPIPPGGGVVFQPARVLHRGVAPDSAPRYAITLCVLPSPVPWREALNRGTMLDLAEDEKWPRHARELERKLAGR